MPSLAAQYEAYPYPARDPRRRRGAWSSAAPATCGRSTTGCSAPRPAPPLRALFAGGGTGDGAIMLAQQMARAGRPGQVT